MLFHRSADQTGQEMPAETVVENYRWNRIEDGEGRQEVPGGIVRGQKVSLGHGNRDMCLTREEKHRIEIIIP